MKLHYLSSDNVVEKIVTTPGNILNKPTEKSICQLKISDIKPGSLDPGELNSRLLHPGEIALVIGEADSEVDRQIERAIKWMGEGESAVVNMKLHSEKSESPALEISLTLSLIKHEPFKPIWDWTPSEKYLTASEYKERALKLMQENRIKDAFIRFSKAVSLLITLEPINDLELPEDLLRDISNLRSNLYNNMAMCQLKYDNYEHVISLCTKVLARDKNNVRAMYRRGCAFGSMKNIENALNDFQKAAHIEPANTLVWKKMITYSKLWEEAAKKSDDLLKRMFKI
ncbi:peptidyl-prolyl cis-trans isomerase FKBP4 [Microplitis demolitor]|uniref:peptidyl-prolyl cis-trans isomerase FKBP4 n=1 Tax=Microplitis demolitor TaxID=69319 RepID=UPI0004CD9616|nr:peptidyl-prolyl cis-trans isomerase FKBP4 [Microplitis demolitor]XP_008560576.1 peptidyl-prolyl cis-trans isomerase FKBP4 [Microplitis demolitor]